MKIGTSIFSREFRKTFNANKYMDMTARVENSHLHAPFQSFGDLLMGRFGFTGFFVVLVLTMYHDTGYFHETVMMIYVGWTYLKTILL